MVLCVIVISPSSYNAMWGGDLRYIILFSFIRKIIISEESIYLPDKKKFFITGILSKEESRNNGLSHTPRLNPKSPNCRSSP